MQYIHKPNFLDPELASAILSEKDYTKQDSIVDQLTEEEAKIFLKLVLQICLR